jgi:glycosyltransferase involved in cell wall biosynthesis
MAGFLQYSKDTMKKIGIDCRLSGQEHAGIGRYIEELILRLPTLKKAQDINWIFFFYSKAQADLYLEKIPQEYRSQVKTVITPIRHYSVAEQLKLPIIFNQQNLDLLHIPHFNAPVFYRRKTILTIHDLLWHQYQGLKVTTLNPVIYWIKYLGYRLVASIAITKAAQILVPAKTIKQTLLKFYPQAQGKIKVTPEGHSDSFGQIKTTTKPKKQLIYVGSLYPHKNIEVVIKALKNLPDFQLKIVGARNIFLEETKALVKKYEVKSQVDFTGYLTDQELNNLLAQSWALVQPSFSEGFGLTGVEAMAAGIPVIASDIPIFREVYQDAPIYFKPHQANSFVEALKQLTTKKRTTAISKGKKVAAQYDWSNMAQQTLDSYLKQL